MSLTNKDPYIIENVPLYEAIYGKHLISLGGFAAIDNMFSDINLKGLKAFDLGFGLGGVAYYLAKKYQIEIEGVEVHPWLARYAKENAPLDIAHLLKFTIYNDRGKIPQECHSLDLVYSKGVLNHVEDKNNLFHQIYSILKPNGLFIIADWLYPKLKNPKSGMVYETKETYQDVLEKTGFREIQFRNDSHCFYSYVQLFLENLDHKRDYIEKNFGKETLTEIENQHQELLEDILHERKYAMRIIAKK